MNATENSRIMEAVKMGKWTSFDDIEFIVELAKAHNCKLSDSDDWNFWKYLIALYEYGKIEGKREERARRNRGGVEYERLRFVLHISGDYRRVNDSSRTWKSA